MYNEQPISDIKLGRLKVSDLSSWEWCNEQSYLSCNGVTRKRTVLDLKGLKTHGKVVRKPMYPWELEFFSKLETVKPIFREINKIKIYAGVDAIDASQLKERIVRIVEHKSRGKMDVPDYLIPSSKFQLEIYCWVYRPLIEKIDYKFADDHYLVFIHRDSLKRLKVLRYEMDYSKIMDQIRDVLWKITFRKTEKCESWKCKFCADEFKEKCKFRDSI